MTKPGHSNSPHATDIREATFRLILTDGAPMLTAVSDSVQALLGYPAADFLSGQRSLPSLIHPEDRDIADLLFSPAGQEKEGVCNLRLRQANGRILCVKGVYRREATADGVVLELQLQDAKSLPRTMAAASKQPLFVAMMENTDDYIYFKDRNHVFTGASQTLVTLCAPAVHWTDMIGQTDYDVFPEPFADLYYSLEKKIFAGLPVAHEVQKTLGKDGRKGWVDNRKYPIRDASGAIIGLYGIARDITALKQAERAISLHSAMVKNMTEGIYLTRDADGLIVYANERFEKMFGYEPGEMIGKDVAIVNAPGERDPAETKRAIAAILVERGEWHGEIENVRKDGTRFWCEAHVSTFKHEQYGRVYVSVHTDITARKQAEAQLQAEKNRFKVVLETAEDPIFVKDNAHRMIAANRAFCDLFAVDLDQVIGQTLAENVPADERQHFLAVDRRVLDTGVTDVREELLTVGGVKKTILTKKARFIEASGKRFLVGSIHDITLSKQALLYGNMAREILHALNEPGEFASVIQRIAGILKTGTEVDAVGIRLQLGEDFPYFAQEGFPADFLRTENTLVAKAADGGICRNPDGSASLECTCGLVIAGKADAANKLFTPGGSCWINDSLPLLKIPASEDPRVHPRNVCIHRGYASIALIPIRAGKKNVGLIQLNDRRKGCFSLVIVELLEGIATHIGAALVRREAEEFLRRDHTAAERMRRALLSAAEDKLQAETALHETNDRLFAVMENLSEGLIVGDDQGQTIYWNPAALALNGYADMQDCQRHIAEYASTFEMWLLNEERPLAVADWPLNRALRGERLHNLAIRLRRLDQGWEKIIAYSGWLIRRPSGEKIVFLSATDITERLQAEEKTRQTLAALELARQGLLNVVEEQRKSAEQLRKLSAIIEQAPLSVVITDLNGVIEYVNPRFCLVTGYTAAEAIGQNPRILKSGETPPEVYRAMWATLTRGEVWTGALSNRTKGGEAYLENVIIAPVVDAQGQATHFIALKDDITAKKRHEEEMTAKLAREHELSEMKTRFISVTSHEFRTPMAAAMGSVEILANHLDRLAPEKRQALLARINTSLHRMTEMLDEVLLVNRMDANRVEVRLAPLDLHSFVHQTMEEIRLGDRDAHRFEFHVTGVDRDFPSDTNLLHHILSNLLSNAVRYSPAGTAITVRLEISAEQAQVAVEDHGIGIPESDRARIFEPFERGSNVDTIKGTGLGLNIVQKMTTLLGGSVALTAVEGGGSRFTVTLPRPQLPPPAS